MTEDRRRPYAVIALLSASLLAYEVLLTRVCALRLHFHFGFLVVSNGLLGIAASGTLLTATEERWKRRPQTWIWRAAGMYVLSLLVTWWLLRALPVPDALFTNRLGSLWRFVLFNLVAAVPFFSGGTAVGLLLTVHARRVHAIYAWDLVGAGCGCIAIPLLLPPLGAGGCFLVVTALGLIAFAVASPARPRRASMIAAAVSCSACIAAVGSFDAVAPMPGKGYLDLTDTVRRSIYGKRLELSRWSAHSRIDVLALAPAERFMFCRGARSLHLPLPDQKLILQDGSAGTIVSNYSEQPWGLEALKHSLYALSLSREAAQPPRVLVLGMGGGNDVWAAKAYGASHIRAVELNEAIVDVHRELAADFSRGILDDPRIEIVVDEARSALMRDGNVYDAIQMTGIDTWTSLSSGGYILAENYLYTKQALRQLLDHLAPEGMLQITRMAAAMEMLRLVSNLDAATEGRSDLANSVLVVSTRGILATTIVKKTPFTPAEIDHFVQTSQRDGYDLVYVPGSTLGNVVERFIRSNDKQGFIQAFPRDISATTDDRPYFFNFTRWSAPLASGRFIGEVASVSQGNPLFLLTQLAISSVMAVVFVLAPLWLVRRRRRRALHEAIPKIRVLRWLGYFAALGAGFIAIEIGVMQKLTLVLGLPLYSIVVTLATLLLATGVGSWLSERLRLDATGGRIWLVPLLVAAMLAAVVALGERIVDALVIQVTALRFLGAAALVAPIGVLLGVPFAHGIRLLRRERPSLIPWAWAVNGSATVVGSVATVVLSMNAGFDAVMVAAAGLYLLAFVVLPSRLMSKAGEERDASGPLVVT